MNNQTRKDTNHFLFVGVTFERDLDWHQYINPIAESTAKKPTDISLLPIYTSSINLKRDQTWSTAFIFLVPLPQQHCRSSTLFEEATVLSFLLIGQNVEQNFDPSVAICFLSIYLTSRFS